jgi:hypothetical protein
MEIRRATFGAAIRLAVALSVIATAVAITLDAIGEVSRTALVLTVIVVGFMASWIQTGRVSRTAARRPAHRLTVVALHHPVG